MAKRRPAEGREDPAASADELGMLAEDDGEEGGDEEVVLEGTTICALTGEPYKDTAEEQTLQSLIEQLHHEYEVDYEDMERDARLALEVEDTKRGGTKTLRKTATLVVYDRGAEHVQDNIIRVVVVAKSGTKPVSKKGIDELDDILASLNQREAIYGLWTNGDDLAFRMRTFHKRTRDAELTHLTDFPAQGETLDDLETAERRPLRIAAGDSLVRTFKRCHNYLYGNQNVRDDKAFWQILFLIFAKILDEQQSRRAFFVGATEGNSPEGQRRVGKRIRALFEDAKEKGEYAKVFDGSERITLEDRQLTYIAAEIGRYNLLATTTDAKGPAYEAITSTTMKRQRGQFFTPRNVISMMVEMLDPQPGQTVLDPACGSGGFLVAVLAHVRRGMLRANGCPYPDQPLPSELKAVERPARKYAEKCIWGIDVDPDLRKAAAMNMVMNNDGHGNIGCFNSLEFGVSSKWSDAMEPFRKHEHHSFDFVLTNPPFGAKIPVDDPDVLDAFDLGHRWTPSGETWTPGERHKKVPPEILFIECCAKFLKRGTGVMAIVLPNGILGNPGKDMEAVRWWMLHELELLASVDLPAEAFLPQVSVQASCVFLRRRAANELRMVGGRGPKQGPVFMAIAENCGHTRRGEKRYVRLPDGTEQIVEETVPERWESGDGTETKLRKRKTRVLADDMPWIAKQYRAFVAGKPFEES